MNDNNTLSEEQVNQVSGGADTSQEVTCPSCGSKNTKELFTMKTKDGTAIVSYKCLDCKHGFTKSFDGSVPRPL